MKTARWLGIAMIGVPFFILFCIHVHEHGFWITTLAWTILFSLIGSVVGGVFLLIFK